MVDDVGAGRETELQRLAHRETKKVIGAFLPKAVEERACKETARCIVCDQRLPRKIQNKHTFFERLQ